jgi:hypothetical protein
MYTVSLTNEAFLVDEEGTGYSDDATTSYTCYAPLVSKTAETSYNRYWEWEISKVGDQTELTLEPGETFLVNYTVVVTPTVLKEDDFTVFGDIDVSNPAGSPGDMTVDLADTLGDGSSTAVDCDGLGGTSVTVSPGETETCSYTGSLATKTDGTNTATATFNSIDFTDTEDYAFGDPSYEIDECIVVDDDKYGDLFDGLEVCVDPADPAPATFNYSLLVGPYTTEDCDVPQEFNNTATFTTTDTGATGSDDWTVIVNLICEFGCTLTQGYWKTHSLDGPAGPPDPTWEPGDPGGDGPGHDTAFYLSGDSWIGVMWTAPKGGNAYYILAHQWIAAYLNSLTASWSSEVNEAYDYGLQFFNTYEPDDDFSSIRDDLIEAAEILAAYNEGDEDLGPGHCDAQ